MTKAVILVDFDNVFYGDELSSTKVQYRLEQFISECLTTVPEFESLEVRLYGGWKSNTGFTQRADTVRSYMDRLNSLLFPRIYRKRRILGNVNVVTSQYGLDVEWDNTLQEKHGRHMLKVKTEGNRICHAAPAKCPLYLIANATRGAHVNCPIDGCESIDIAQLIRMEQKMVDTMMTCDILEYVHEPDCRAIEVVSDDVDLHPALALAGSKYASKTGVQIILLVHNQRKSHNYATLLNPYHVRISNWK